MTAIGREAATVPVYAQAAAYSAGVVNGLIDLDGRRVEAIGQGLQHTLTTGLGNRIVRNVIERNVKVDAIARHDLEWLDAVQTYELCGYFFSNIGSPIHHSKGTTRFYHYNCPDCWDHVSAFVTKFRDLVTPHVLLRTCRASKSMSGR